MDRWEKRCISNGSPMTAMTILVSARRISTNARMACSATAAAVAMAMVDARDVHKRCPWCVPWPGEMVGKPRNVDWRTLIICRMCTFLWQGSVSKLAPNPFSRPQQNPIISLPSEIEYPCGTPQWRDPILNQSLWGGILWYVILRGRA